MPGSVGAVVSPEAAGSLESGGVSTAPVSSSGSELVGVGAVDAFDSVLLVCAPPLLLMVTPDAIWVDEDVVLLVDVDSVPAAEVDAVTVPVVDSPDDVWPDRELVELSELVDDDSDEVAVVSATAKPGEEMTITPTPRAAANAPTRPI